MATDTGSPAGGAGRPRPRAWMGVGAGGRTPAVLALRGLTGRRRYGDQLLRQTEGELIGQGVVLAEAYRSAVVSRDPPVDFGVPRSDPWPFPVTPAGRPPVF